MSRRLLIDLYKCEACTECGVTCDYFYRADKEDHGMLALRERATFLIVCRRCEEASCVNACPVEALERQADGVLLRHNLRCISCQGCVNACPFGTIYPDMVPFYESPCDYCLGRIEAEPACVSSCAKNALEYRDVDPSEESVHLIDDFLAVRAPKWEKRETTV